MDAYEATRIVFSRIQSLDPENASKIMGLLLIQDHGEKEMIRLAFGPEALVHSVVLKARKDLGLSPSTPSTPSSPSPFFPNSISRQNSSSFTSSSRMLSNLSPSSSSWAPSTFSDLHNLDDLVSPNSTSSASYTADATNGFINNNTNNNMVVGSSSDLIDEFQLQDQLSFLNDGASPTIGPKNSDLFYPPPPDPATSPGSNSDGMLFPSFAANWGTCSMNNGSHRRSCSVTDICMGSDPLGSGLGWKPCLYFARGYCKNGTSCRFLHGLPDSADSNTIVGSPGKLDVMEQCQELLLRSKTQQQLRLSTASQLMASATFPYTASTAGKCMNFLLQQQQQQQQQNDTQRAAAAALMLGEDVHKFGRTRMERNEFSSSGGGLVNPGSRQIYLTFPADSTFREEDVSNYFSIYGPVQDVRIPYQQKRMFGFVTFVYPETVKLILAKGNPHFVCDARVLVKPYKEKGKVPDKYRKQHQQQQAERGDFTTCTSTGLDSRDPYDLQLGGARMFNNTQDVLLRRKLEEHADLQQAIELQGRRLMGLQLLDVKKHHYHHQHSLSTGAAPIPSPTHLYSPHFNHSLILPSSSSDRSSPESPQDNYVSPAPTISLSSAGVVADQQPQQAMVVNANNIEKFSGEDNGNGDVDGKGESPNHDDDCNFHNSVEHNLPDSPFASPTKSGGDPSSFFTTSAEAERNAHAAPSSSSLSSSSSSVSSNNNNNNNNLTAPASLLPAGPTLDMASFKSCFFQMPRFSSGHGAIGM